MIETLVTWNDGTPTESVIDTCHEKINVMVSQGKTDGLHQTNSLETTYVVTRVWNTLADAQEWINFVNSYSPVSAVVQES